MERQVELRPPFQSLEGKNPAEVFEKLPTPSYIIEEMRLKKNGELLASVMRNTGCRILLAQKAFSNFNLYPLLSEYLSGTEASGLYEARLGAEEMPGKEVHVFCAAYREREFEELLRYADHIVFNSRNSDTGQNRQEKVWVLGLIRNALPRKGMKFMILVQKAAGLV